MDLVQTSKCHKTKGYLRGTMHGSARVTILSTFLRQPMLNKLVPHGTWFVYAFLTNLAAVASIYCKSGGEWNINPFSNTRRRHHCLGWSWWSRPKELPLNTYIFKTVIREISVRFFFLLEFSAFRIFWTFWAICRRFEIVLSLSERAPLTKCPEIPIGM